MFIRPVWFWAIAAMMGLVVGQTGIGQPDSKRKAHSNPAAASEASQSHSSPKTSQKSKTTPTPTPPANRSAGLSNLPSGAKVAVLPIEGMIYQFTLKSLKRRVKRALANGADVIVLELNTNGGVATAGTDISQLLKDAQKVPVPTVAWVHPKAYSAGILIGGACNELVMSSSSVTGDCAPIVPGKSLKPTERAKALAPLKSAFRDSAQRNGYDYAIFHAMIQLGVKLYLIENKKTHRRKVVNQVDYALMTTGQPPKGKAGAKGGGGSGSLFGKGSASKKPNSKAKIKRDVAKPADLGAWKPVEHLSSGTYAADGMVFNGQGLFAPNQTLARDIGFSEATVSSDSELRQYLNARSISRVNETWSEGLSAFLTMPIVRGILVMALLAGAYLEIQAPGFGVGGAVALAALVGLIAPPLIVGLADIWHILVLVIGFGLFIVELLFIPSFGLLGIIGLIMMFIGLVLSAVPGIGGAGSFSVPPPELWDRLVGAMVWTLLGVIGGIAGLMAITHYFGRIPVFNRLILAEAQASTGTATSGIVGGSAAAVGPSPSVSGDESIGGGRIHVGDMGRVSSIGLRPAGRAEIDGQVVDVVSVGGWVNSGTPVEVVEVHGNRIVVDER